LLHTMQHDVQWPWRFFCAGWWMHPSVDGSVYIFLMCSLLVNKNQ
jgi:hypothetical protein